MLVSALDSNGDFTFGQSLNNYLTGLPALRQMLQTRLSSFLGNCFFDMGAGIDWFTYCGGSKNPIGLNLALNAVILNTFDENGSQLVTGILQLNVNLNENNRSFTVSYQVQSVYSVISATFTYDLGGSQ